MKTLILAGSLVLASLTSLAGPTPKKASPLNYRATQNLYAMYGQLDNVEWRPSINNMVRADFEEDGTYYAIFFNEEGEFLAETKKVERNELPAQLRRTSSQKFKDVTVLEMLELTSEAEHLWFFKTVSDGQVKIWKGTQSGGIEQFGKK
ncbi:MAG TPA: hypothetical protein VLC98_10310 [Phnomibacter sp.]|nr:hypothetical protein [Phnomibacter sp.]